MFENLFDTDPPMPGLHEFARVTERARELRQRRAWVAVWASLLVALTLSAGGLWALTRSPASSIAPAEPPPSPTQPSPAPTNLPAPTASDPIPSTIAPLPRYQLEELATAGVLPPIELIGGAVSVPTSDGTTIRISAGDGQSVCVDLADPGQQPTCSDGATALHVARWPQAGDDITAVVVDAEVDVAFIAVGAECSPGETGAERVAVWVCTGLDIARAYADVVSPTYVLIGVPAERR